MNDYKKILQTEWIPEPFIPPAELTIQVSGICFTENQKIILVNDGRNWQIPGGAPEVNESIEKTLIREIREEACAEVIDFVYIGSIKSTTYFDKPDKTKSAQYKIRFWVRIRLNDFNPQHETIERIEIQPDQFESYLSWNAQKTAREVLESALLVENIKSNFKRNMI